MHTHVPEKKKEYACVRPGEKKKNACINEKDAYREKIASSTWYGAGAVREEEKSRDDSTGMRASGRGKINAKVRRLCSTAQTVLSHVPLADGACLRPAFAPIGAPNHPMASDAGWFPRENKDEEYRFDTITPIRCGRS
jgi:hypothetical protein